MLSRDKMVMVSETVQFVNIFPISILTKHVLVESFLSFWSFVGADFTQHLISFSNCVTADIATLAWNTINHLNKLLVVLEIGKSQPLKIFFCQQVKYFPLSVNPGKLSRRLV